MEQNNGGFREFILSEVGKILMIILFSIIYYAIIYCIYTYTSIPFEQIVLPCMAVCTVIGWLTINKVLGGLFVWGDGQFILFVLLLKLMLAFIVGMFATPVVLATYTAKGIQAIVR